MEVLLFAILGLGLGGAYSLMAQGVLVMYQGSGTINFAQGAIAMAASYLAFWELQGRVPVAAAMANALTDATGIRFAKLPFTPPRLFEQMRFLQVGTPTTRPLPLAFVS